jgi:polyisoprenoid-binding protein YceI
MKKKTATKIFPQGLLILFGLFLNLASPAALSALKYEAGTYTIDAAHSKVGFEVPHYAFSSVEGKFTKFEGSVIVDEKFEKSKVTAEVEISSIDTGNAKRDDHLKGAEFFNVSKNPKMSFKSTSITGSPESFKLIGPLTLNGHTEVVTFDAKFLGNFVDMNKNLVAAFSAKTKISRKLFGLTWNKIVEASPVVGDEVTLDLKIESGKAAAAKPSTTK